MRPRMYGSRLRKWCLTSTWPSPGVPTGCSTRRKLSVLASPLGRETRWIWWLMSAMATPSVGRVEALDALAARRQALQVLERPGRMGDELAARIDQRAF